MTYSKEDIRNIRQRNEAGFVSPDDLKHKSQEDNDWEKTFTEVREMHARYCETPRHNHNLMLAFIDELALYGAHKKPDQREHFLLTVIQELNDRMEGYVKDKSP